MGWVNKDSNIKTYQLGGDVDTSDIIKALRPDIKQARSERAKEIDDARHQRAAKMAASSRERASDVKNVKAFMERHKELFSQAYEGKNKNMEWKNMSTREKLESMNK